MDRKSWESVFELEYFWQELDWFAIDNLGQIGVFTAILNATVPKQVGKSYEQFMDLKHLINNLSENSQEKKATTESGDFSSYLPYVKKGLFAYDFQDVHRKIELNRYDLIYRPTHPINISELQLPDILKNIIPKFNCDFNDGNIAVSKIKPFDNYNFFSAFYRNLKKYLFKKRATNYFCG